MRTLANNVEYFDLIRDQLSLTTLDQSPPSSPPAEPSEDIRSHGGLRDSLWYFDGTQLHCWTDVEDLFRRLSVESESAPPTPLPISTDFYPTSIALNKGVVLGLDADLTQRRDVLFAFFRASIRASSSKWCLTSRH